MLALPLKGTLSPDLEFSSDINTGKDRCGVAKIIIRGLRNFRTWKSNYDLEGKLWPREKYWQAQSFTLTHGMNSTCHWFISNRRGYRKKKK